MPVHVVRLSPALQEGRTDASQVERAEGGYRCYHVLVLIVEQKTLLCIFSYIRSYMHI